MLSEKLREAYELKEQFFKLTLIEGKYGTVYYKPADDQPYTLLYNRVLALLLNVEGVEDFASLTVNGGTADVTIQAGEIPVLGEVTVT